MSPKPSGADTCPPQDALQPDSKQCRSHRGALTPPLVAPQPLPLSLTHLPVVVAEIRTQGVEIQGEPQSAAHQLCNHLSTAFPPAWLPARAQQQQQQKTEASIPTFRRLLLLVALFPGFPARLLVLPPLLLPIPGSSGSRLGCSCVLPGLRSHTALPMPHNRERQVAIGFTPPGGESGLVLFPAARGPHPNPWHFGTP